MSAALRSFLAERLSFPGLAGWGARLPDNTLAGRSGAVWLPEAQLERALARLMLAAESLKHHQIRPQRICWVFDNARVLVAVRPDKACLALWVPNQPGWPAKEVNRLLDDFLRLAA
jgi:hypothetical protein